jgi:hypothetical protein
MKLNRPFSQRPSRREKMKSHFKTWCVAAVVAATVLLSQFSASAETAHGPFARNAANTSPGVSPNCLSSDQVGNPNPQIHPPCSKPYGLSYGEWSARWWQWLFAIPPAVNPNLEGTPFDPDPSTPNDCAQGQSGPVWFLGGTFGPFNWLTHRQCTIPTGVSILFPVVNVGFGVLGGDCLGTGFIPNANPLLSPCLAPYWPNSDPTLLPSDQLKVHNWNDLAALIASGYDNSPPPMVAEVDNRPLNALTAYRAKAPMFSITAPSSNLMGTGVADTYGPNGSDGFWLMLTPLSHGEHTIHFASGDGFLDVSYTITVR